MPSKSPRPGSTHATSAPASGGQAHMSNAHEDSLGLERIIFFSDAVIAIAITLLVLEIKIPQLDGQVTAARLTGLVLNLWPKYLGYAVSFWVIALHWMAHQRLFRFIRAYDRGLIYINFVFLMFIAFMPFSTALLFSYAGQKVSVIFYAATVICLGLALASLWRHASANHRLIPRDLDSATIRSIGLHQRISMAVFALSIVVAFFDASLAMCTWLILLPASFLARHYMGMLF